MCECASHYLKYWQKHRLLGQTEEKHTVTETLTTPILRTSWSTKHKIFWSQITKIVLINERGYCKILQLFVFEVSCKNRSTQTF